MFNFKKTCSDLLSDLSPRTKKVIEERFGFGLSKKKTLESIGKDLGVCRERVRQIEENGFDLLRKRKQRYEKAVIFLGKYLKDCGGLRKESVLLKDLSGNEFSPEVSLILNLSDRFEKFTSSKDFYPVWTIDKSRLDLAKKLDKELVRNLNAKNTAFDLKNLFELSKKEIFPKLASSLNITAFSNFLETSKRISEGPSGEIGLISWPQIKPHGIKDKAYLVFKKENKPLYFGEIASLIKESFSEKKVNVQTVHNELIKDQRFVLIGRGIYALKEWGYKSGFVKDVIFDLLKESKVSLTRKEILDDVLSKRKVKQSTVLLNLNNRNCFSKDEKGGYTIKKA